MVARNVQFLFVLIDRHINSHIFVKLTYCDSLERAWSESRSSYCCYCHCCSQYFRYCYWIALWRHARFLPVTSHVHLHRPAHFDHFHNFLLWQEKHLQIHPTIGWLLQCGVRPNSGRLWTHSGSLWPRCGTTSSQCSWRIFQFRSCERKGGKYVLI